MARRKVARMAGVACVSAVLLRVSLAELDKRAISCGERLTAAVRPVKVSELLGNMMCGTLRARTIPFRK